MHIPESLLYSTNHLWAKPTDNDLWDAGITDYAQDLLGDIVFIEAPAVGSQLVAGQPCGLVESVKTGSDLHALVHGEVVEINKKLINDPELINQSPYEAWIFKFKPNEVNLDQYLLSASSYKTLIANL